MPQVIFTALFNIGLDAVLVTNNLQHYQCIEALLILENWA